MYYTILYIMCIHIYTHIFIMDFVGLFWQLKTWQPWRLQVDLQFHQLKEVRAVAVELRWKLVRVSTISIPLFGSNSFWRGEWMEGNIFQEALVSRRLDSFTRLPGLLSIAITFLGTRLSSSSGPGCLMGHIFKTADLTKQLYRQFYRVVTIEIVWDIW